MKKILTYSKGSRFMYVLAPLFKMLEATLELIVPLIIAEMIDTGIALGDKPYIFRLSLQLVILGLVGLCFSITAQFFAAKASVQTIKNLKHSVYEKVQNLSVTQVDKFGVSRLITNLTSDMDSVQNGINLTLRLLLRSPFIVIGACIMAYKVDTSSSKIFAVTVPVLAVIIFGIMLITSPLYKKVRGKLDTLLTTSRESITGARVLRAFNRENAQAEEFAEDNDLLTSLQVFTGKISALLNPLTCIIINLGISVLIFFGAKQVNAGHLTTGCVVALYNYMSQILVELVKFANLTFSVAKSVACSGRISLILDEKDDIVITEEAEGNKDNFIEFRNVSFRYEGASDYSLKDISFTVKKGEKIGITGSTGSGKTTLINLLSGLYRPTEGKIFIEGKDITAISAEDLRNRIALAEQSATIFSGTVRSNILYGNESATDDEINNALKDACAIDFVTDKGGTDSVTEQNGQNFSGGQKQRLSVARALVRNADILILDDVYSALDFATEAEMSKAVSGRKYGATFVISQRTGSILNSDKIIVLEDGIAETGTHEELLAKSDVYREIHFSQSDKEVDA